MSLDQAENEVTQQQWGAWRGVVPWNGEHCGRTCVQPAKESHVSALQLLMARAACHGN